LKKSDNTAWVTQQEFKDLPEYSTSFPTALPVGKTWRRKMQDGTWRFGEVVAHEDGDAILKWRKLVVMPPEHEDQVLEKKPA
jgi:hypothetical protein